jgi:hypothetical protein
MLPSTFCHQSIEAKLEEGSKKDYRIHKEVENSTEAYYNVKYLTDYFQKKISYQSSILLLIDWIYPRVKSLKVEVWWFIMQTKRRIC